MTLGWSCLSEFSLEKIIQFGWFGASTTLLSSLLEELGMVYIND